LLEAVAVNVYCTPDCKPCTTIGEDVPAPVKLPGLETTLNDVGTELNGFTVKATLAAPLLKSLSVPTSVATRFSGGIGFS